MKNLTSKLFTLLLALFALGAYAQYTPQYQRIVTVTEPFGNALTDYPVLIIVDTQTPIAAGQMQANGEDIRFTDDCAFTQTLDYWIESGVNTTATRIWVRIPTLTANATTNLYMSYGDAAAAAASSFSATFPNAVTTSGDITLTGTQQPGWLHVQAGDTLFVNAGAPLEIIAGYVRIDGVIMAKGMGYQVSIINTAGTGPGAGGTSANSGSGGGSYAGTGGTGGLDAGDTPGAGGATYGTLSGNDIDMGSSGGSGTTLGGSGGGAVTIKATRIYISGTINANGADALATASRGGGGGAGGGVLLMSDSVIFSGSITASGGAGGQGSSTFNDGGGGGGGGRTKIFSDAGASITGATVAAGGAGGGFGDQASGTAGTAGTNHAGTWTFAEPTVATQINISVSYSEANNSLCVDASSVTLTPASPAGGSYSGSGVSGSTIDPSAAGAGIHTITYSYTDGLGCVRTATSSITVNALPTVSYTEATGTTCAGAAAFTLSPGSPSGGSYSGTGVTGSMFDPAVAGTGTHDIIYSYTDGSGCMNSDTSQVTVNALPVVTYVETTGNVCVDNASFTLAAGLPSGGSYSGTGVTGSMFDPAVAGTGTHDIIYSYTDGSGCMNSDTSQVTVNALPVVTYVETAGNVCVDNASFTLAAGSPSGGSYSGTGVTGSMFDPAVAGTGTHDIVYSYTDGSGCMNSDTSQVTVNALPVVTYVETAGTVCIDNASFTLAAGSPVGGTYSGPGITGSTFDPATAGLGTHDIIYSYTDGTGCMNSDTSQIVVDACTGIAVIEANVIGIYPNPANSIVTINILLNTNVAQVKIYNAIGSLVKSTTIVGSTTTLDVSDLAAGVYTLGVYSAGELVKNSRMMISR